MGVWNNIITWPTLVIGTTVPAHRLQYISDVQEYSLEKERSGCTALEHLIIWARHIDILFGASLSFSENVSLMQDRTTVWFSRPVPSEASHVQEDNRKWADGNMELVLLPSRQWLDRLRVCNDEFLVCHIKIQGLHAWKRSKKLW